MPKKDKIYAVIDIETTGGMAKRDKITEIAIVLFNGEKILDTYETLINPERSIPVEITRITGITDRMVADAPKFYEVAKKIVEMTENTIFVAHNVRFDYSFIKEAFANLGFTYTRPQLCTVVLSRKSFPGLRSYSLGNLIQHFGIKVSARHRALDDTLATVDVLRRALNTADGTDTADRLVNAGIKASHLPATINIERLQSLPEEIGVYYFYNTYGVVIYVGKSINIKKRIAQHFANIDSKTDKFIQKVADIGHELTGSELIAMLLESYEIKSLQPEINKAQRSRDYPYFVHYYHDENGYLAFECLKSSVKIKANKKIVNHYSSKEAGRSAINFINNEVQLCGCINGLNSNQGSCFYYQTEVCIGAGISKEDTAAYNQRAEIAIELLKKNFDDDFLVLTDGRNREEIGIVLVQDGHYRGFGYFDREVPLADVDNVLENIGIVKPNPECNQIIITYLSKHPTTKMIRL